jgi:hypothetical protein
VNSQRIARLIAGAFAVITASNSFAGQAQSAYMTLARESITSDAQTLRIPSVAYRFSGDIDARVQDQTFQIQFTLAGKATWATPGLASSIVLTDGIFATPVTQGNTAGQYSVTALALSADNKTLYATLTIHSSVNALVRQPIVSIASASTASDNPQINNMKSVIDDIDQCDTAVKSQAVSIKHYVALSNPAALATDANAIPDEHVRSNATNTTNLFTFSPGILMQVQVTPAGSTLAHAVAAARQNPARA